MQINFRSISDFQPYALIFERMREFTLKRTSTTEDEVWFLEHEPVYTQGQAGKPEHILRRSHIPIVQSDRGGQVTYHGPGQLMVYCLIDLQRRQIGVRDFVSALENTFIDLLEQYQLKAHPNKDARGVYLEDNSKIASIGLRVRKGKSYHGVSFNMAMDLSPFNDINPCGYERLKVTQLKDHVERIERSAIEQKLKILLSHHLKPVAKPCKEYEV